MRFNKNLMLKVSIISIFSIKILIINFFLVQAQELLGPNFDVLEQNITIPVLCYHRFGDYAKNDKYAITSEEFKKQLAIIKEEGFLPLTASQLANILDGQRPLPAKPILITIDDGYKDFIKHADPYLSQYDFTATLFVYTQFIGSRLGLSQEQLIFLQNKGYEIGSHTISHPKLTKRRRYESKQAWLKRVDFELLESRRILTEWLGKEVISLAYPYGLWDQEVAQAAEKAGYRVMFTVSPGLNSLETPKIRLKRIMIFQGTKASTFRELLYEKPLAIRSCWPQPGQRSIAPLSKIEVILDPNQIRKIDTHTLVGQLGNDRLPLKYFSKAGKVVLLFDKPWRAGANLFTLLAVSKDKKITYKISWLILTDKKQKERELV